MDQENDQLARTCADLDLLLIWAGSGSGSAGCCLLAVVADLKWRGGAVAPVVAATEGSWLDLEKGAAADL